jgi:DegV family protein with EDD domain
MAVAIVTDGAAALPAALASDRNIAVVPMWLTVDGESIHEDDISQAELLTHDDVTTSGPTPGEFEGAIKEQLRGTDDGVLVLTLAATMSSTHEAAVIGARAVDGAVSVIDTTTAAGAQALVVLAAADAAAGGATLAECEAVARAAMEEVRLVAMVPNLDHLVRSGRVPKPAGWAGRRLGIAPLFEFRDGGAHALRPALGAEAALDRIVARWHKGRVDGAALHVAALHAQAEDQALALLDRVKAEADPVTAFAGPFSSVMVAHTGRGLVGLAWRWSPTRVSE